MRRMAVTLVIRSDGDEPSVTFDQPRVAIGRGEGCDLRIPEPSVSHRHASIRQRGTDLVVVDEGSTNGTFVGTARLHPHSPMTLHHGSMLRFGRVWVEVKFESVLPTSQPVQVTKDLALAMVARALGNDGVGVTPRLVVVEGPDAGREVTLEEAGRAIVIGRGRDVDFPIDVADASRRHARVVRRGEVALLRDLGSRNGTQMGGEHVAADRDTALRPGDRFVIGPDVFVFENPAVEVLRQIESAEDEALRSDEPLPDPPHSSVDLTPEPPAEPAPPVEQPKPAPRPMLPRNERRSPAKKGTGWGKADLVIVLLALAVLALSAVGMFWLFRGP